MNFPLISEYIEAVKSAEDNFEELSCLRPVLGDDGLPVMTSGNFAVVFKMKDEQSGKFYAVKCFTKEQEGRAEAYREITKELKEVSSPYLVSIQYLDKELFVDTDQTSETEFPVLLMDWVGGKTLDKYLRENLDDKYALEMLAYRFSQLAQWLIPQHFAHGDLKPDNILVREDGTLVLVDYDGMYVPAMKGQKARELGSPDFRHPLRTENDFDEHIDVFPLLSILLSLKAVSLDSRLLENYGTSDRLLFSVNDYREISNSIIASEIQLFTGSEDCRIIMSVFLLCLNSKELPINSLNYMAVYFEGLNNDQYNLLSNDLKETISKAITGDKVAQKSLGYKYYYGEGLSQNYAKAIYWYKASASHGYSVAFYNLGICYQQGSGVNKSYFEAFKWFLIAAEKGYADAQYQVGLYYKGYKIGVRANLSESFKWFLKAAQQGDTEAQKQIEDFDIYSDRKHKKDIEGFHFFSQLAEKGDKYGLYILGKCYWNGYGVDCDFNQALVLFKKAALKGHKMAQREVEEWKDSWWDGTSARYSSNKEILKEVWKSSGQYNIIEGTKIIRDQALSDLFSEDDCSYLDKVSIPTSVIEIGQNPFNYHLSEITCFSPYFEVEDNTLYSKGRKRLIQCLSKADTFYVPLEVKRIDDYAFYGCKSKRIIIGENVEDIGTDPFVEMEYNREQLVVESKSPHYTIIDSCLYDKNGNMLSCWKKKEILTSPHDRIITDEEWKPFLRKESDMEKSVRQCIFQEIPLDLFAESHGMVLHDVITLLEDFSEKGNTFNIDFFIEDYLDKESVYEIYDYFLETGNDDLPTARHHLKRHSDDVIRLVRIKYLSDSASIKREQNELFALPF